MKPVGTFPRIITDESLRETATHGSADYPFQYYLEDIWDFDLHCVDWHWHTEIEFFYIRSGAVEVSIGSRNVCVPQGWGMFINSQTVHRFTSQTSTIAPNIVFSPALLAPEGSLIFRQYVQPLLECSTPYILFDPQVPWQAEVLEHMQAIFRIHEAPQPDRLKTQLLLLTIWESMVQHTEIDHGADERASAGMHARLQIMIQFIHDHYPESLTLQSIADSVHISKSSALQIFQHGIQQSPIAYLIGYRLAQAAQMLRATENSVSVIALETGFASAGYFCRKFRERYSCTPNEYRRDFRR